MRSSEAKQRHLDAFCQFTKFNTPVIDFKKLFIILVLKGNFGDLIVRYIYVIYNDLKISIPMIITANSDKLETYIVNQQ